MILKLKNWLLSHKLISLVLVLAVAGGGYYYFKNKSAAAQPTRYVTATVEKGTLVNAISGSGQVLSSSDVEIKSKVSGDVIFVGAANGQTVSTSTVIARIDSRDAQKAVRDAQTAVDTARLDLNKLQEPPTALEILQAESALTTARNNLDELIHPSASDLAQAENSLQSAKDTLAKLKYDQPNNHQTAVDAIKKAEVNLDSEYEDMFNAVSSAFSDLPDLIGNLNTVINSFEIADSEPTLISQKNIDTFGITVDSRDKPDYNVSLFTKNAQNNYQTAKTEYDSAFSAYKDSSRDSAESVLENLLDKTANAVRAMSEAAKSEANLIDFWIDYREDRYLAVFAKVTDYQTGLKTYSSSINNILTSLLSAQRDLEDKKEAVDTAKKSLESLEQSQPLDLAAAERSVAEKQDALDKLKSPDKKDIASAENSVREKELSLENLKSGADDFDIRSKKITIQQKLDALQSARDVLSDYEIRAPFDGIISGLEIKKGDSISANAIAATLLSKQQIGEITLNEVDIAGVKTGQKVNITFDAIEDLSISGKVAEVDTAGTVSQNVVSYTVKIAFDTQDERIKPGMSLSAEVITAVRQDTLLVSSSAITTQGDISVVQSVNKESAALKQTAGSSGIEIPASDISFVTVTAGLSNDTMTEITEGLKEGDTIIIQTIAGTNTAGASNATQNRSGSFGIPGMGGGGGNVQIRQFSR